MSSLGPLSPGTIVDDATVGTVAWADPGNAAASDNIYSVASVAGTTHYLKATNFGFTVPTGATIDGIVVEIERKDTSDNPTCDKDNKVQIVKSDGSIGTTDKADLDTWWPLSDTYKTYGSSSDLWGESWTAADINDSDFGVVLQAFMYSGIGTERASVDHIRITVYYTEVSGAAVRDMIQGGFMPFPR